MGNGGVTEVKKLGEVGNALSFFKMPFDHFLFYLRFEISTLSLIFL